MKWMTVNQVADYLQLSTMMVYKLAQDGKIPSSKIGRVWRFEQGEIDRWLQQKSGGGQVSKEEKVVSEILQDFVKELKKKFSDNFFQVLLFGSHARGEATEESDIDVLVVLNTIADFWKMFSEIEKISYGVTFEKNQPKVLSVVLIDKNEFLTGNSPLLLNIREEGRRVA